MEVQTLIFMFGSRKHNEKGKLMFKVTLLGVLGLAALVASPITAVRRQEQSRVQCVTEFTARKIAEETSLPEYPEEAEPGSSRGVVFAAMLFGTDGRLSKIKFYETPNEQTSEAVKKAVQKWKLRELFDGGQQPIMTRTALRFHFVFEDGKGRVDLATDEEQREFGGEWGKKACKSSLDE
jgi:hypothetical protein